MLYVFGRRHDCERRDLTMSERALVRMMESPRVQASDSSAQSSSSSSASSARAAARSSSSSSSLGDGKISIVVDLSGITRRSVDTAMLKVWREMASVDTEGSGLGTTKEERASRGDDTLQRLFYVRSNVCSRDDVSHRDSAA